jgi:hypothetical protein
MNEHWDRVLEPSIVMPCLNEAETLEVCNRNPVLTGIGSVFFEVTLDPPC